MADYYIAGTISLTNGSAAIVGTGTAWQIANVAGGTIFVQGEGNPLPLASIEDDTHATAALEWTGATGTYLYALLRATAFSEQLEANSNIMSRLLVGLEAGTLYRYDASGDTADRATFDDRPEGFAFLAVDVNPADLYIKASAASGDWAGPFSYGTGPQGPAPAVTFEPVVTGAPGTNASMAVTGSGEAGPFDITFTIPAGDLGINWRGAYSGPTAYEARDGVLDNGSAWIALQATTGNSPPVLPTTSNAYWSLIAAKGTDGTGTGDVVGSGTSLDGRVPMYSGTTGKIIQDSGRFAANLVTGPASSVDGAIPAFSGATGKLLKTLTNAEAKAWLASTALDVSFSNAIANLPGSPTTVQAAIDSVAANSGGKNDALLALEIADLKGSRMGMKGGIADAFDDETGVNTGGSTNQAYDATNDWYTPSPIVGTGIVSIAPNAEVSLTTQRKYRTKYAAAGLSTSGSYIRVQLTGPSAGPSKQITNVFFGRAAVSGNAWDMDAASTTPVRLTFGGSNSVTPPVGGSVWSDWVAFPLDNTKDHIIAMDLSVTTANVRYLNAAAANTATYYKDSAVDEAGTPAPTGYFSVAITPVASAVEVKSTVATVNNMTLVSAAYTAASAPSTGRLAVQLVEVDSITINTDVTAEVSRDGGTTWSAVTLALSTNLNGVKVYEGTASISGQPSGASMRWRVKTLNNKNVDVSGVVLQWS